VSLRGSRNDPHLSETSQFEKLSKNFSNTVDGNESPRYSSPSLVTNRLTPTVPPIVFWVQFALTGCSQKQRLLLIWLSCQSQDIDI